jgi:hypothetical protein
MKSKHIVISGTGRAGTSFLVHLLTELGYDTGFKADQISLHPDSRAGLEHDLRKEGPFPYIVKDPAFCYYAEWAFERYDIERVVLPVRRLESAAQSRRDIHELNKQIDPLKPLHGGGLFGSMEPVLQEAALAMAQHRLIEACVNNGVPVTLLSHRKMMSVGGWSYLYGELMAALGPPPNRDVRFVNWIKIYEKIYKESWVH